MSIPGTALILLGHGARDPTWSTPMQRLHGKLRAQKPELMVENAFLEFISPKLDECAGKLIAAGANSICILPLFIAQGGHLKNDIALMVQDLTNRYPQVNFRLQRAVGESDAVVDALAQHALWVVENEL